MQHAEASHGRRLSVRPRSLISFRRQRHGHHALPDTWPPTRHRSNWLDVRLHRNSTPRRLPIPTFAVSVSGSHTYFLRVLRDIYRCGFSSGVAVAASDFSRNSGSPVPRIIRGAFCFGLDRCAVLAVTLGGANRLWFVSSACGSVLLFFLTGRWGANRGGSAAGDDEHLRHDAAGATTGETRTCVTRNAYETGTPFAYPPPPALIRRVGRAERFFVVSQHARERDNRRGRREWFCGPRSLSLPSATHSLRNNVSGLR